MNRGRGKGTEGKGKGEKEERRKGEPVGIHQYFDCKSFIMYAGLSFKRTQQQQPQQKYVNCGLSGNAASN